MNKKNLPLYFSITMVLGIFIGTFLNVKNSNFSISTSFKERKIKRLLSYIEQDYVDSVNTDYLLDDAIKNMLEKLDPHSIYIPKEKLLAIKENMQGNFVGIGVKFRIINDTITVIETIKDGPSIKAGIKNGDRILMSNKHSLFGKKIKNIDILKKIKGKPNTKINIQVYRKSNDSLFNVIVTRGSVNIKSIDIAYMLNNTTGYIKINRFAQNTYIEFKRALKGLLSKGMTDLVMDLRGNSGGFVHIAYEIADEFLSDKKLVVFTKNNKGIIKKLFATDKGDFENGGLYVLIDQNSASASEILAGALQDNDKGTIIGRRSFGKGLVQEEMSLGDGSAVRLTTARYYTPTGRSIQKPYKNFNNKKNIQKIKNFHSTGMINNYDNEIKIRYKNGELFFKDSIKVSDSLKFKTPKGKIVYGGGGIIPDVFVPIDTSLYIPSLFFIQLNDLAFNYVDNNRKELSKLTFNEFLEKFDNNFYDKLLERLNKYIPSNKIKENIREYLKELIAIELFNDEGLYKIKNKKDKMIEKVFELESEKLH